MLAVRILLILFLMLFTSLKCVAHSSAPNGDNVINIIAPQNDPFYEKDGLIYRLFEDYLSTNFPQYQFNYIDTSYNRFWHQANLGQDICNMLGIPWPTDKNTLVSRHATFELPKPVIIISKQLAKKHNILPNIDAFNILTNETLIGAYTVGRRLHNKIDQKILSIVIDQPTALLGSHFSTDSIKKLLELNRIDYFVGLPATLDIAPDIIVNKYQTFEFKAYQQSPLHLVCGNNKKNKLFVAAFDQKIRQWYAHEHLDLLWRRIYKDQPLDSKMSFKRFTAN